MGLHRETLSQTHMHALSFSLSSPSPTPLPWQCSFCFLGRNGLTLKVKVETLEPSGGVPGDSSLSGLAVGPLGLQMCPGWVGPLLSPQSLLLQSPALGELWNQRSLAEPAPGTRLSCISLTTHPLNKQSCAEGVVMCLQRLL